MKKLTRLLLALVPMVICTSTMAAPPDAPQNLQQAWLGTESLLLWDEASGATNYNIYRADNTNTAWVLVGSSSVPRFRDPTLQFLPSFYVVTGLNGDGESLGSNPSTVMFAEQFTIAVYEPQSWDGTLSPTNAIVGMATSDANGGQGLVDWGLDITNFTGFLLHTNYLPAHSFELTNLSPRTIYYYRVTSITSNRAGVNYLGYFSTPDTNHPPVAEDYNAWWWMPTNGVWITLRGYDSNMPSYSLTFRISSQPTNGTLSGLQAGWGWNEAMVYYTPTPGARGYDYFRFVVNNGTWDSAPALVTVTNWVNTPPAVTNGSLTTAEDTPVAFSLPAFDAENDPVTFIIEPWSAWNGTVSGTPPNLVFTPNTNFNGFAWFWYRVTDGYAEANGNFTVNVTPVNDKPEVRTNFMMPLWTYEEQPKTVGLMVFDEEWGQPFELVQLIPPTHGTLTGDLWNLVYTPETNFFGIDYFTVAVREADGTTSDPMTLPIEILSWNDAPVVQDQDVTTLEDTVVVITPVATDVDSSPSFTFRIPWLSWPLHGWVEETGTNFIYHPSPDFNGSDEFQFQAQDDGGWWSSIGTIRIQVTPVVDLTAPENLRRRTYIDDGIVRLWWQAVPSAQSYSVYRADGSNAPFNLLASGVNTTNFNDATAQWQQPYFYRVSASDGTNEGPVSGTVFAYPDTTGILTVNDQYWGIHSTTGLVIFFTSVPAGTEGIFEYGTNRNYDVFLENTNILPSQRFSLSNLTPATLYYFRITTTDANGNAIVASTNHYQDWFVTETWPLANSQSVTATEDTALIITMTGSDPNSHFHPITYSIASGAGHGTLTSTGPNTWRYLPATNYNGADSFTFKVNNGELDSAPATVSINVTAVNDLPVAANISKTVAEDVSSTIPAQFSDVDGGTFTVQIVTQPAHGFAGFSGTNLLYLSATNYFGPDSFTYRVGDGSGFGNTATVSLTVTNVNDAPVATNASFSIPEDTTFVLSPTMVAMDVEGSPLFLQVMISPSHGTLSVSGTNLLYRPATNYFGPDYFNVRATDGSLTSATVLIIMTVQPVNDRPTANGQSVSTAEDTAKPITLTGSDIEGGALSYTIATVPAHGTLNGTGASRTYTPATNYNGPDSFTFFVNDGLTNSATATVTITVSAANDAPIALPQSLTLAEDASLTFSVSASDVDDGAFSFEVVTSPTNGTLNVAGTNYTYYPMTNFVGGDSFTFRASDGTLWSAPATISITVTSANDAPIAFSQAVTASEDASRSITLTGTDVDGETLTFSIVSSPSHGTLSGTPPDVTYQADPNYNGADSFTFQVTDGNTFSAPATVSITVSPINDAPIVTNRTLAATEDTPLNFTLTGSDVDGDALTFRITSTPLHGTVTGTGPSFTYTPDGNYNGTDSFNYTANDGTWDGNIAAVVVTIAAVNDAPSVTNQGVTTVEDASATFAPLASDIEGGALTFTILTAPTNGTTVVSGTNLIYTPNTNYNGADSFEYQAHDANGGDSTATVSITITPANDAPVASAQNITLAEDGSRSIALTGTDVDGDTLSYAIVSEPTHGTLSGTAPNVVYTPDANYNGVDGFTFSVNDGTDTATATINITVTAVNDVPVANAESVTLAEDGARSIVLTGTDVDGDTFSYTVVTGPTHGTLSGTAPNVVYTPDANYNGTDGFSFRVNDGTTNSAPATVSITVTPVNDAPVANNESRTLAEDTSAAVTLTASDVDGDGLTFSIVTAPLHGTLSGTGASRTYTPAAHYNGPDSFTFLVNDGTTDGAAATVSITVTPVNDAPSLLGLGTAIDEDTPYTFTLTASDVDNDPLTYIIVSNPTNGTLTGTGPTFTYTPSPNYNGLDVMIIKASDGIALSGNAYVSLTMRAVNDSPVGNPQTVSANEDSQVVVTLTGSDVEGGTLSYTRLSNPAHGTITGTPLFITSTNAVLTYTPAANYSGPDSFTFRVHDPQTAYSAPVTVTINVAAVNDAPVADPQSLGTSEDTSLAITFTASDVENDALAYIVVSGPAHGAVSGSGSGRTYTPAANYSGPDSFTFKANDRAADGPVATINITVTPVNDAPVANPQNLTTPEDAALPITLTGSDVETASLIYTVITLPAHGTVNVTNSASLTYTPAANYFGADSITFLVSDGTNTCTAVVNLNVTSVNDAPIANAQSVTVNYNTAKTITLTGSDPEGSALTYSIVGSPTNGTLSGTAPNLTYTPSVGSAGADRFTFRVNDGGSNSATVTVSITTLNPTGISAAPTSLTVTVPTAIKTLILSWSCTATNEDGFKVERSLNGSSGWSQIATTGINIHTFTNTGLTSNTRYYYRVRSYNRLGNSDYSNTANAKAR